MNENRIKDLQKKLDVYADIAPIPVDVEGLKEAIFMDAYWIIQQTIDEIYSRMNEADKKAGTYTMVKEFIEHCVLTRDDDSYFVLTPENDGQSASLPIPDFHYGDPITAVKYGTTEYSLGLILHSMFGSAGEKRIEKDLKERN